MIHYDSPSQSGAAPQGGMEFSFYKAGQEQPGDPFMLFDDRIREGGIVAVKGLGGYHLACDAQNETAVARLRERKVRYDKPFAVMMRDIETARCFCHLGPAEETLLRNEKKPILLLRKKEGRAVAQATAPHNSRLGVMLPYSPQHSRIMEHHDVLVMTSANISDRPTIYDDDEAMRSLFDLADGMLTHNRKILRRMDDSVCLVVSGRARMIRRSRGYAQEPLVLKGSGGVTLALGAQQKNTFCITKGEQAYLSGHIGDLDDMEAEKFYEAEIEALMRRLDLVPEVIARDMHPDYVSTRYGGRFRNRLPVYDIQHHHAHFASVLAEHDLSEKVIGLIFDGTGYGEDGALWGGEALWGDRAGTERIGHMLYAPLLGGEAAIREPWRMALAMLHISCGEAAALDYFKEYGDKAGLLLQANEQGMNWPVTSGAGRLFDAVAALAGIRSRTTYEGQAAIDLEQALDDAAEGSYGFDILQEENIMVFDWRRLIRDIVRDRKRGCSGGVIAARFHRAVVRLLADAAALAGQRYGCSKVALSGGVFQNAYLLGRGIERLQQDGFEVYANERVPANDGGISYGQAAAVSHLAGRMKI